MDTETRTEMLRDASFESVEFRHFHGDTYHYNEDVYDTYYPSSSIFNVRPFRSLFEVKTKEDKSLSRREWKDFQHYKCRSTITNTMKVPHVATVIYDGAGPGWNYILGYHSDLICQFDGFGGADTPFNGTVSLYAPGQLDGAFIPPPANLEELKQSALKSTMPYIKAELSLVNSLIELKDIKSLPHTIKSTTAFLPEIKRLLSKASSLGIKKNIAKWSSRELLRVVGDNYLQFAFNLQPLISDIRGIYTSLTTIERRINRLISQSARTQVKHYTVVLPEFTDTTVQNDHLFDYPLWSIRTQSRSYCNVMNESSKFHFQIEYNYNYTQYQLEHARVLALLDSFGVAKLSTIVWNAIPWSFVVDWLIGVGQYISQFGDAGFMKPVINIHRCLWSIKRSRKYVCTFDCNTIYPTYPGYLKGVPASVVVETAYRRQNWVPTASSLSSSGLSLNEFSLGSALVVSRRRPKRKR